MTNNTHTAKQLTATAALLMGFSKVTSAMMAGATTATKVDGGKLERDMRICPKRDVRQNLLVFSSVNIRIESSQSMQRQANNSFTEQRRSNTHEI
jgi:hypothetical protein